MKKFTKICLKIAAVLVSAGLVLGIISGLCGGGIKTILQMAENGELDHGFLHIRPDGIYFSNTHDSSETHLSDTTGNVTSHDNEEHGASHESDREHGGVSGTSKKSSEDGVYEWNADDISEIELDVDAAKVRFAECDDDVVRVTLVSGDAADFSAKLDKGELEIEYDTNDIVVSIGVSSYDNEILVEMPSGMSLDIFDIDIDAGEVDFDVSDFSAGSLSVEADAADVEIDGLSYAGGAKIDVNAGNVELAISGSEYDYNYSIECGVGSVQIGETDYTSLSTKENIKNQGASALISIECNVGNVEISFSGS